MRMAVVSCAPGTQKAKSFEGSSGMSRSKRISQETAASSMKDDMIIFFIMSEFECVAE